MPQKATFTSMKDLDSGGQKGQTHGKTINLNRLNIFHHERLNMQRGNGEAMYTSRPLTHNLPEQPREPDYSLPSNQPRPARS